MSCLKSKPNLIYKSVTPHGPAVVISKHIYNVLCIRIEVKQTSNTRCWPSRITSRRVTARGVLWVCCFVLLNRYWGIVTVPGSFLAAPVGQNKKKIIFFPVFESYCNGLFLFFLLNPHSSRACYSRKLLVFGLLCRHSSQMWPTCLSFGFSFFFFFFLFKRTSVALLKLWEVEDYTDLGTPCPRNLTIT